MVGKFLIGGAAIIVIVLRLLQLVPYGRDHANPPVRREPAWDSPQTRAFAVRACFDCHSNQTLWLWYSNIAPISWRIYDNVMVGRAKVNFSEWDLLQHEPGESAETVSEGTMPPADYLLLHPSARLTSKKKTAFIQGLIKTFGGEGGKRE